MNDMNSLENRLRQWTPRRPSADLKRRVFTREQSPAAAPISVLDMARWLVPALGCFMLVFSGLTSHNSSASFMMAGTNEMLGAFAGGTSSTPPAFARYLNHSEQNNVPATRLEFQTGLGAPASEAPISDSETNHLSQ